MMTESYYEPLALVVVGSISIGIAAIAAAWIALDIVLRRGWRSMMLVMIPVYIINALYLWPITLWTYIKYSRPEKADSTNPKPQKSCHAKASDQSDADAQHNNDPSDHDESIGTQKGASNYSEDEETGLGDGQDSHQHHQHHSGSGRPMFATVTIGVCHCGAGCVLGDIVGEWIVYATGAAIGSPPRQLWVEYLVDFAFAFAFGIVFQYFSIAPMTGDYGPKTVVRALKADTLSLLFFEIGLFGWMAAFQIGIFGDRLPMNTVTYWFMMQIGMFLGHWTGVPINWWLIKKNIKEPCA